MLERGKFCSSAAIATALAISSGNQISCNREGDGDTKLSLYLPNERYACNTENVYALPRTDLHEVEWLEPDSIDGEISRLGAGSSSAAGGCRNNQRRCCRTSTSSGYSSHSPPLSAGSYSHSYSCYATLRPPLLGQNCLRAAAFPMRDQFTGGLAVIHEADSIPRPIWPSTFSGPQEFYHNEYANPEYDGFYAYCGCSCACTYSSCDWDYARRSTTSARDVLVELSRTLNSAIKGEITMTPEEILRTISRTVAQEIGINGGNIQEYACRKPNLTSSTEKFSSLLSTKSSGQTERNSSVVNSEKSTVSRVNPVNSKLYRSTRNFYAYNSAWSTNAYGCEHNRNIHRTSASKTLILEGIGTGDDANDRTKKEDILTIEDPPKQKDQSVPQINATCVPCIYEKSSNQPTDSIEVKHAVMYQCGYIGMDSKRTIGLTAPRHDCKGLTSGLNSEYTMQLECSDGSSSSEGMIASSEKSQWEDSLRGFIGDFDFTLDVSRAERLGRAIAKAKRRRQWCRALTAFFGLVFFVLSVVVVSLSVTRGQRVFGSM